MTIKEILELDCKRSSVEGFFSLLWHGNIHRSFVIFTNFSLSFRELKGLSVYLINFEDKSYFKLCFEEEAFLLYRVNDSCDVDECWLVDFELYKKALRACVEAVDERYLPVKDINEKIF